MRSHYFPYVPSDQQKRIDELLEVEEKIPSKGIVFNNDPSGELDIERALAGEENCFIEENDAQYVKKPVSAIIIACPPFGESHREYLLNISHLIPQAGDTSAPQFFALQNNTLLPITRANQLNSLKLNESAMRRDQPPEFYDQLCMAKGMDPKQVLWLTEENDFYNKWIALQSGDRVQYPNKFSEITKMVESQRFNYYLAQSRECIPLLEPVTAQLNSFEKKYLLESLAELKSCISLTICDVHVITQELTEILSFFPNLKGICFNRCTFDNGEYKEDKTQSIVALERVSYFNLSAKSQERGDYVASLRMLASNNSIKVLKIHGEFDKNHEPSTSNYVDSTEFELNKKFSKLEVLLFNAPHALDLNRKTPGRIKLNPIIAALKGHKIKHLGMAANQVHIHIAYIGSETIDTLDLYSYPGNKLELQGPLYFIKWDKLRVFRAWHDGGGDREKQPVAFPSLFGHEFYEKLQRFEVIGFTAINRRVFDYLDRYAGDLAFLYTDALGFSFGLNDIPSYIIDVSVTKADAFMEEFNTLALHFSKLLYLFLPDFFLTKNFSITAPQLRAGVLSKRRLPLFAETENIKYDEENIIFVNCNALLKGLISPSESYTYAYTYEAQLKIIQKAREEQLMLTQWIDLNGKVKKHFYDIANHLKFCINRDWDTSDISTDQLELYKEYITKLKESPFFNLDIDTVRSYEQIMVLLNSGDLVLEIRRAIFNIPKKYQSERLSARKEEKQDCLPEAVDTPISYHFHSYSQSTIDTSTHDNSAELKEASQIVRKYFTPLASDSPDIHPCYYGLDILETKVDLSGGVIFSSIIPEKEQLKPMQQWPGAVPVAIEQPDILFAIGNANDRGLRRCEEHALRDEAIQENTANYHYYYFSNILTFQSHQPKLLPFVTAADELLGLEFSRDFEKIIYEKHKNAFWVENTTEKDVIVTVTFAIRFPKAMHPEKHNVRPPDAKEESVNQLILRGRGLEKAKEPIDYQGSASRILEERFANNDGASCLIRSKIIAYQFQKQEIPGIAYILVNDCHAFLLYMNPQGNSEFFDLGGSPANLQLEESAATILKEKLKNNENKKKIAEEKETESQDSDSSDEEEITKPQESDAADEEKITELLDDDSSAEEKTQDKKCEEPAEGAEVELLASTLRELVKLPERDIGYVRNRMLRVKFSRQEEEQQYRLYVSLIQHFALEENFHFLYLSKPEDFTVSQSKLFFKEEEKKQMTGKLIQSPGGYLAEALLQREKSICLLIDWTTIAADQIAHLNTILDGESAHISGIRIPQGTIIISLFDKDRAYQGKELISRHPSPQIWDLSSSLKTLRTLATEKNGLSLSLQMIEEKSQQLISQSNQLEIDLHRSKDWRTRLFGATEMHGDRSFFKPSELIQKIDKKALPLTVKVINPPNDPHFDLLFSNKKQYWRHYNLSWDRSAVDFRFLWRDNIAIKAPAVFPLNSRNPYAVNYCVLNPYTLRRMQRKYRIDMNGVVKASDPLLQSYPANTTFLLTRDLKWSEWSQFFSNCHVTYSLHIPQALGVTTLDAQAVRDKSIKRTGTRVYVAADPYLTALSLSREIRGTKIITITNATAAELFFYYTKKPSPKPAAVPNFLIEKGLFFTAQEKFPHVIFQGINLSQAVVDFFAEILCLGKIVAPSGDKVTVKDNWSLVISEKDKHLFNFMENDLVTDRVAEEKLPPTINEPQDLHCEQVFAWRRRNMDELLRKHKVVYIEGEAAAGKTTLIAGLIKYGYNIYEQGEFYNGMPAVIAWKNSKPEAGHASLYVHDEAGCAAVEEVDYFLDILDRNNPMLREKHHYDPLPANYYAVFISNPASYRNGRQKHRLFDHCVKLKLNHLPKAFIAQHIIDSAPHAKESKVEPWQDAYAVLGKVFEKAYHCSPKTVTSRALQSMVGLLNVYPRPLDVSLTEMAYYVAYRCLKYLLDAQQLQTVFGEANYNHPLRYQLDKKALQTMYKQSGFIYTESRQEIINLMYEMLLLRSYDQQQGVSQGMVNSMIVQGAPGIGKSELVRAFLKAHHVPFLVFPARGTEVRKKLCIQEAREQRKILIVDEIDTQWHENHFNKYIGRNGCAKPLVVWGTCNGAAFKGRMIFSPATISRYACIQLPEYTPEEMAKILQTKGIQAEEKLQNGALRQLLSVAPGAATNVSETVPVFYRDNMERQQKALEVFLKFRSDYRAEIAEQLRLIDEEIDTLSSKQRCSFFCKSSRTEIKQLLQYRNDFCDSLLSSEKYINANFSFQNVCNSVSHKYFQAGMRQEFLKIWDNAKRPYSSDAQKSGIEGVIALFKSYFVWHGILTRHCQQQVKAILKKASANPNLLELHEFIEQQYKNANKNEAINKSGHYVRMLTFANAQLKALIKLSELPRVEHVYRP